jgi:hypothetical protein
LHDAIVAATHSGPERRGHRHAPDFSVKVPPKPIAKIGAGWMALRAALPIS